MTDTVHTRACTEWKIGRNSCISQFQSISVTKCFRYAVFFVSLIIYIIVLLYVTNKFPKHYKLSTLTVISLFRIIIFQVLKAVNIKLQTSGVWCCTVTYLHTMKHHIPEHNNPYYILFPPCLVSLQACFTSLQYLYKMADNILSHVWRVTTDGLWTDDQIYWTLWCSAWLHFTVHCYIHTLLSAVMCSLLLLGSGFQRQMFSSIWLLNCRQPQLPVPNRGSLQGLNHRSTPTTTAKLVLLITSQHRPHKNVPSITPVFLSPWIHACLRSCYLATAVI
jgi:hypothetical protein